MKKDVKYKYIFKSYFIKIIIFIKNYNIYNIIMVKTIDNKFAIFIIILIVVGLFLHYEMGYNLELFTVGGSKGNRKRHHNWRWHHHHYDRSCPTQISECTVY